MRSPSLEDLVKEPFLGALAVVDIALIMLARALRGTHPDVDRAPRPGDDSATATARQIVDGCDVLLYALDHYRDLLEVRLRTSLSVSNDPF